MAASTGAAGADGRVLGTDGAGGIAAGLLATFEAVHLKGEGVCTSRKASREVRSRLRKWSSLWF